MKSAQIIRRDYHARVSAILLAAASLAFSATAAAQPTPPLQVDHRGASAVSMPLGPDHPEWMAAHIINVGQGSAALFEFSCGLMLVDTGGQADATINWQQRFTQYIDQVFARRPDLNRTIDVVYITHPHPDHTLGIPDLIAAGRYNIRYVVTDATTTGAGKKNQQALIRHANLARIPAVQISTSLIRSQLGLTSRNIDPLRCSGSSPDIRVLWGTYNEPHHWTKKEDENENNQSVAVRVRYGESSFLITGDMEEPAQQALLARYARNPGLLNIDVYVAGHHGSKNGTIPELVRAMMPEIAVMSAGNPDARESQWSAYAYGHPNKLAIGRLSDAQFGVSYTRPSVHVPVGIHGRDTFHHIEPQYEFEDVNRAIFATGWDGDIVILANADGRKRVIIN
jgi:competence protein ComEC